MSVIKDTAGNTITLLNLTLTESVDSAVLVIRVPCTAGLFLTADNDARLAVKARENGSGDPFVNIASSPIDLTPYDGTDQDFDLKVTPAAVTGFERVAVPVRVTTNP